MQRTDLRALPMLERQRLYFGIDLVELTPGQRAAIEDRVREDDHCPRSLSREIAVPTVVIARVLEGDTTVRQKDRRRLLAYAGRAA